MDHGEVECSEGLGIFRNSEAGALQRVSGDSRWGMCQTSS